MKTFRNLIVAAITTLAILPVHAQTYVLSVDSVYGIPDTIYDGETIDFTMVFSNQSNLAFQGEVNTAMLFNNQDSAFADSTVLNSGFVAAQSQSTVSASHLFSANGGGNALFIGDNVVVVWPRIGGGPVLPPQEVSNVFVKEFYLAPALSVPTLGGERETLRVFPNPASDHVRLILPSYDSPIHIQLVDMTGRVVRRQLGSIAEFGTDGIPSGIYTICAHMTSGVVLRSRLLIEEQ